MNNRDAQLTLLQGQLVAARATQASLQQRVMESTSLGVVWGESLVPDSAPASSASPQFQLAFMAAPSRLRPLITVALSSHKCLPPSDTKP